MSDNALSVEYISATISSKIQEIDLPQQPAKLYDPIRYILSLSGKRLRPLLAVMSYNLFSNDINDVILPVISIEAFHNFTLIHDDIMDEAPLRRGEPTVHKKWDKNVGILSGDTMLVKAYELLSMAPSADLPELLAAFNKTAIGVCEGQQLDMDYEERSLIDNPVTEAEYMNMIRLKTSVLFGFSLELGGIMGSGDKTISQQLYSAGVHLGLAFQLQDDLLDLYGGENFGKQIGGDILNAKKTYLLVKLLELASNDDKKNLAAIMTSKSIADQKKIVAVSKLYDKYHIANLAREQIKLHLDDFRETMNDINASKATRMIEFVNSLANRAV
jgi:geranylgeranyl diphosphate synthase type II